MIVLDKKIIMGICACCFVSYVGADFDSKESGDVHGNYWGFSVNKQGDGPIEVESERSTYNKDGIVQSKKESGYLEFDRLGRAYIRKANDRTINNNKPLQPIPVSQAKAKEQTSRMGPGHRFNRECLNISDKQSMVQKLKRELLEMGELIEHGVANLDDEVDRDEIYHFLKEKMRNIKKTAKFLLKHEDFHRGKKKKWFDFI
jgi:hypothetical protein